MLTIKVHTYGNPSEKLYSLKQLTKKPGIYVPKQTEVDYYYVTWDDNPGTLKPFYRTYFVCPQDFLLEPIDNEEDVDIEEALFHWMDGRVDVAIVAQPEIKT
jgi:hypothetical protein